MKIAVLAPALLAVAAAAAAPDTPPYHKSRTPAASSIPAPPLAPKPGAPPQTLDLDQEFKQPARSLDYGRAGDASGYQTQQEPLTAPGVDPNTGKPPEREFNGLRFGTSIDDEQRLGPRAR